MHEDLEKKLYEDFPMLYRDRHASMRYTCMCWGFEVGDGWEPLIRDLSGKLEALIVALPKSERRHFCASQVKEKFGTLRFYMTCETDEMAALIREAEKRSSYTCETCGGPGKLRGKGWLYTACDEHEVPQV